MKKKILWLLIGAFSIVYSNSPGAVVSFGTLTLNGEASEDFNSGCFIGVKVPLSQDCSFLGLNLKTAFGVNISSISGDNVDKISMNSFSYHVSPSFNIPVNIDLGFGYGKMDKDYSGDDIVIGSFGASYSLPFSLPLPWNHSANLALAFEYHKYMDVEDGEFDAGDLDAYTLCLKLGSF
tara:strand:+ start:309 stop:845 length:537 start_codon:yes stop_codon:yes gene_type:complete